MNSNLVKDTFLRPDTKNTKRIEYLDLIKGLCIVYLLLWHNNIIIPVFEHMCLPAFFLISGYWFRGHKNIFETVVNKFNSLLLPFLFFFVLGFIYFNTERFVFHTDLESMFQFDIVNERYDNRPIWFLLALFWDNLILLTIYKLVKKEPLRALTVFTLCFCGVMFFEGETNYLKIGSALFSLPFFYAGYLLQGSRLIDPHTDINKHFWIGIALLCSSLAIIYFVESSVINFNWIFFKGNPILAYILSFMCLLGVLMVCKKIKWLPFFTYVGKFSLIILGIHMIYINFSAHIVQKFISDTTLVHISVFIVTLLLSWLSIPLITKLFPGFCNQKKLLSLPKGLAKKITAQ